LFAQILEIASRVTLKALPGDCIISSRCFHIPCCIASTTTTTCCYIGRLTPASILISNLAIAITIRASASSHVCNPNWFLFFWAR
ncbi:unnamed protein product, partial [Prunus brigantina]